MGTQSSNEESLNDYVHPRLGKITRTQNKQSEEGIQYSIVVENGTIFQKWIQERNKLHHTTCTEFLFLPYAHKYEKIGMCGTGGKVTLSYGDYMFTLEPQIRNRSEIKRPFQQVEIWYMLYVLVRLQAIFQELQIKIGDIQPNNILVNEDGALQVISQFSWPGETDNFLKSLENQQERVFLAPEECKIRRMKKSTNQTINQNQAEIFSIGLTILQACTLKECSDLYTTKYHFKDHMIKQYTDVMEERYSKILNKIVRSMLRINPTSRKTAKQIESCLQEYDQKLLSLTQLQEQQKQEIERKLFQEVSQSLSRKVSMKNIQSNIHQSVYQPIKFHSPTIYYPEVKYSMKESIQSNSSSFYGATRKPMTKFTFNHGQKIDY